MWGTLGTKKEPLEKPKKVKLPPMWTSALKNRAERLTQLRDAVESMGAVFNTSSESMLHRELTLTIEMLHALAGEGETK
jgi:hypothetical protein